MIRLARLRAWTQALTAPGLDALTGGWEQAAAHAEHPERGAWDRQRPDGTWHLPWVTSPDRWIGPLRCGRGHWHARAHLGLRELP